MAEWPLYLNSKGIRSEKGTVKKEKFSSKIPLSHIRKKAGIRINKTLVVAQDLRAQVKIEAQVSRAAQARI